MDETRERPSFLRRVAAILILALAAYVVLKLAIGAVVGLVMGLLWAVVALVVVVALVWALRHL